MDRLSVLALVPYPPGRAPSQRYRLEQWMPYLEAEGVDVTLVPFQGVDLYQRLQRSGGAVAKLGGVVRALGHRAGLGSRLDACDVVLLHREAASLGPAWIERWVARTKPIVFDFDDAIWMRSANPRNPLASWLKVPGKTRTIVELASAVLAGNRYLAQWAGAYNDQVHWVPTTIDTERVYTQVKEHRKVDRPVVGWTGSASTLQYLEQIRGDLVALSRTMPFTLRVIGPPVDWPDLDVEHVPWRAETEVTDLLPIDVGLMPQPDNPWTRGKCGAKALQYMGLGIPPVVSATGVLPEIVVDDVNGILVPEGLSWVEPLERLLADVKLRQRLGREARLTVVEEYSADVHAPRVAEVLRSVAAGERMGAAG